MVMRTLVASMGMLAMTSVMTPLHAQQPQPAPSAESEVMARGQVDGTAAAGERGTAGWTAGGVASGLVAGLIGTAIIYVVANNSDVSVPADRRVQIAGQPALYQQGFESGYGSRLKARRRNSALTGGLIGTGVFLAVYLASQ